MNGNKKTIAAYDHDTSVEGQDTEYGFLVQQLKDIEDQLGATGLQLVVIGERFGKISDTEAAEKLLSYDIVICHMIDEAWNTLITKAGPSKVLIRTSKEPADRSFPRSPKTSDSGALLFYLQHSHLDEEVSCDWPDIIGEVANTQARDAVNGKVHAMIRKYFFRARGRVLLPALSVLCQGYLAAYAVYCGTHVPERKVREALDEMDWWEVQRNMISEGVGLLFTDVWEKERKGVKNRRWWSIFGVYGDSNYGSEEFEKQVQEELGGGELGEVKDLLDRIQQKIVDDPVLVARVYLRLEEELRCGAR